VVLDLAKEYGPCVYTRVLARLHEAVRLAAKIKEWLLELDPGKPFFGSYDKVSNAEGIGLTEAARGALGHWIKIRNGRIDNYQVITPTAWNVSPKDSNDVHGPIEQAVIGTPVEDENNPIEVQHVIRSYDPCIACTVHVITPKKSYHLKVV
jgi:hydrogenase large subunit